MMEMDAYVRAGRGAVATAGRWRCLVRITRDAGQNATGLIIDEFNWYFPRTEIGRLRVNTEFIRS